MGSGRFLQYHLRQSLAVHEAVNTRTACCVVISHWFEPVAATVACLSMHCEFWLL